MFEQSFGRALAAVTLIGALASTGAVEPTEPQESPARRYSQGGLEFDLPGDWQPVPGPDSDPWNGLTLQSAATRGAIVFIVWLPLRDRSDYLGSFESFVKEKPFTVLLVVAMSGCGDFVQYLASHCSLGPDQRHNNLRALELPGSICGRDVRYCGPRSLRRTVPFR